MSQVNPDSLLGEVTTTPLKTRLDRIATSCQGTSAAQAQLLSEIERESQSLEELSQLEEVLSQIPTYQDRLEVLRYKLTNLTEKVTSMSARTKVLQQKRGEEERAEHERELSLRAQPAEGVQPVLLVKSSKRAIPARAGCHAVDGSQAAAVGAHSSRHGGPDVHPSPALSTTPTRVPEILEVKRTQQSH